MKKGCGPDQEQQTIHFLLKYLIDMAAMTERVRLNLVIKGEVVIGSLLPQHYVAFFMQKL